MHRHSQAIALHCTSQVLPKYKSIKTTSSQMNRLRWDGRVQCKASAKIGFVKFIAAIRWIGFVEDRLHHRIGHAIEFTLRLLRAGLGILIPGFQQVFSAQDILNSSVIGFVWISWYIEVCNQLLFIVRNSSVWAVDRERMHLTCLLYTSPSPRD